MKAISGCLDHVKDIHAVEWDLSGVEMLDHVGAQLLWSAWDYKRPAKLKLVNGQEEIFKRIETAGKLEMPRPRTERFGWVTTLGFGVLHFL